MYQDTFEYPLFSILQNNFLAQVTAQLELAQSNRPSQNIVTTAVTSSDYTIFKR
jgi:hypothetical protein